MAQKSNTEKIALMPPIAEPPMRSTEFHGESGTQNRLFFRIELDHRQPPRVSRSSGPLHQHGVNGYSQRMAAMNDSQTIIRHHTVWRDADGEAIDCHEGQPVVLRRN
jgi:hypothetical protein